MATDKWESKRSFSVLQATGECGLTLQDLLHLSYSAYQQRIGAGIPTLEKVADNIGVPASNMTDTHRRLVELGFVAESGLMLPCPHTAWFAVAPGLRHNTDFYMRCYNWRYYSRWRNVANPLSMYSVAIYCFMKQNVGQKWGPGYWTDAMIGTALSIKPATVKTHRTRLMEMGFVKCEPMAKGYRVSLYKLTDYHLSLFCDKMTVDPNAAPAVVELDEYGPMPVQPAPKPSPGPAPVPSPGPAPKPDKAKADNLKVSFKRTFRLNDDECDLLLGEVTALPNWQDAAEQAVMDAYRESWRGADKALATFRKLLDLPPVSS